METLDLVKILEGCPKGTPLYSTIHGNVKLKCIDGTRDDYPIRVVFNDNGGHVGEATFTSNGFFLYSCSAGECVLFPSKDCRDWSQFKRPQQERADKRPQQECANKQTMRTILAGMAMQSILSSPLWLNKIDNRIAEAKLLYPTIATMAVQQADALLKELNKETKDLAN